MNRSLLTEHQPIFFMKSITEPKRYVFVWSQWQNPSIPCLWYLILRTLLAGYHTAWCLYLFIEENGINSAFKEKFYFFIYLTDWSYTVLTVTNIVLWVNVLRGQRKYQLEGYRTNRMGSSLQVQWLLQNITYMPAVFVSLVYWTQLYEPGKISHGR